jgi:hypothetical protein
VELNSLGEDVLKLLSSDGSGIASSTVASSEYKLRATVLKAPHGDLLTCMEMAKVCELSCIRLLVLSVSRVCYRCLLIFFGTGIRLLI